MIYTEFEKIISTSRMNRYLNACNGDTKKAMTLYRLNLRLSHELFTVISCFEIALRNRINNHCYTALGNDWLRASITQGGIFNNGASRLTSRTISDAITKLNRSYNHNKLVAELGFGFWRYIFAPHQYNATGKTLLRIFPKKPISSYFQQYNQSFVFNQLAKINILRNRIAHHEPICFRNNHPVINTIYIRQYYCLIKELFQWMDIDESSFLYGLDHVEQICDKIDHL